jgi:hypothetical protein
LSAVIFGHCSINFAYTALLKELNMGLIQVGSFNLRVRREVGKPAPAPKPVPKAPQVLGKPMVESIPANSVPAAPKPSNLAASVVKPVSNFGLMEAAADAGLLFVTSPKVIKAAPFCL